ncbi:MAG TPA: MFS transporter, partial [Acetobacteraceae bacterium]|nr:MFS transporter [Acetobacteraceae bacterium]
MHGSRRDAAPAAPALPLAITTATSFGFLLVQLDVSIVNVALAAMGGGLQAGVAGLQWIVDAYALTFAAFLLLAGSLGDRIGPKKVFLAGFGFFLAASLGCGLAPTVGVLVTSRIVQGFGAALMVPSSLALLNHACAGDAGLRHRAVGWWTAAGSVGLALGPVLGGVLAGALGWRSIFLVNLPVGAIGVTLTLRSVPEAEGGGGHFDWTGQALAIVALFGLVGAAIGEGSQGWVSPVVLAS